MNQAEKYERYGEDYGAIGDIEIIGLHDDYEGFRILFQIDDEVYKIIFDEYFAYRNIDEGDRLKSLECLKDEKNRHGLLFNVKNSQWINWFVDENLNKYEHQELSHFAIITNNDWIDVISKSLPKIEKLTF